MNRVKIIAMPVNINAKKNCRTLQTELIKKIKQKILTKYTSFNFNERRCYDATISYNISNLCNL